MEHRVSIVIGLIEGILKTQQNQEGETDTVTVYLFLAKIRCHNFQNAKQRYTIYLSSFYGTSASLRYIQQQNQEGDTDIPFTVTVYRSMAKKTSRFFIVLVLEDVFSV